MCPRRIAAVGICIISLSSCVGAQAQEPPVIPVGLDAIRQWERWPVLRIGARAFLRSTYDRTGGNEGADASHFLYQEADDRNVALELQGPGLICFTRFNHWHGSPWTHEVDGTRRVVRESSTADPNHPAPEATFLPAHLFPDPLAFTWAVTRGADLSWVPIPFEKSYRLSYGRTHYGTGYFIYQQFVPGARLSSPIRSWDFQTLPARDVLALVARSGTDLVPEVDSSEGVRIGLQAASGSCNLAPGMKVEIRRLAGAAGMIRALELSTPRDKALALGRARLRMTWDDRPEPSIDAPVALFFGTGTLYNRDEHEYLVKAFPVHVRFEARQVHLACYFPMPYFHSARIELVGGTGTACEASWSLRWSPLAELAEHVAYFHSTYRDHPNPEPGLDLMLLDTSQVEGGGDWSGHLIGTSFIFSHRAVLNTLDGDPRFFLTIASHPRPRAREPRSWAAAATTGEVAT